jgi:hypothetical protein
MPDNLFQGSQLDPVVSTAQSTVTAPEFYTNYLQDITNQGQNAVMNGGVAGLAPLQIQAMNLAPDMAFAGAGSMGAGADLAKHSGTTGAYDVVGNYMNPFVNNVVDEMARKQQQDIQRNVMPGLAASSAATGNFGSKRMATATGQTLADMQSNLTGQQYGALNAGYKDAMGFAQNDLSRELSAGTALGNIGVQQNNLGTTGLKTMTDLGGIQRGVAQEALDRPMLDAQNYAKLLQGYTIPTATTSQTTSSGAYQNSPLSNIAGIVSLINAYNKGTTSEPTPQEIYTNSLVAKTRGYTANADGTYTSADGTKNYNAQLQPI